MKTCPKCGFANPDDMPFCLACAETLPATDNLPLLAERFLLEKQIGEGGMADVYLATDLDTDDQVAVKILKSSAAHNKTGLERFLLEIKTLSSLSHPALIKIIAYGDSPYPYYVMPYMKNGTLASYIAKNGALSPAQAAAYMEKLLGAVTILHAAKIIHRDIKSENIMLDDNGEPVLLDLGTVKELEAAQGRTALGFIVGSPVALAPEQIMGQPLGNYTDIYQLGLLFSELMLGRQPFSAESTAEWMAVHLYDKPGISKKEKEKAPELMKIALKAMAKKPKDRYQSAETMAKAIRKACGTSHNLFSNLFG